MTEETRGRTELSSDDLNVVGECLPDRELLSLVNANVAIPINIAVAANVLADDAAAVADAAQDAEIDQTN